MEGHEEESLDGSSIKPVSSLRSHFEQMANSKPNLTAPRAISPKPTYNTPGTGDPKKLVTAREDSLLSAGEGLGATRGREREAVDNSGLRPPRQNDSTNISPSPTRFRQRPVSIIAPAVTVEPPQSPPKGKTLNLSLANTSAYLSTDTHTPVPVTSGRSSPRHFRIPSRPHTPNLEPRRSPSLKPSQPPSPPPPRRSGEFRRDASTKPGPPPVNRSEKPRILTKPTTLKLEPAPAQIHNEKSSPFSTPSGSDESPEHELPAPSLPPNRPRAVNQTAVITSVLPRTFEPPPIHHMVVNKRRDQEVNGLGRSSISSQKIDEQRPALPTRPQIVSDLSRSQGMTHLTMIPPPARTSIDQTRSPVTSVESNSYSTTPKRVFSTPTTQVQTPPRSHGCSMTVDRASEKTPAEFRAPISSLTTHSEPRASLDIAPPSSYIKDTLSRTHADYPDSTHSNRRPPCFKTGAQDIPTKYDTRIYDVCGEYVCTSGHLTKVWNLLDGEIVMSLAHTEGIKIVSLSFKPASDVNAEGSRLWLGNNIGELTEVDVASQSVVATKVNAHTRREIIKMYRHKNEMWTLDDGGTLHLWAPDSSGEPTLSNPYQSFRVPKGHTFSMVIADELWHAAGKDIRIFVPSTDVNTQFQVLQRPIGQSTAGDVTSGAVISTQPDKVYFGHVDGKVSIYSRHDYSCLGIVNISVYKITSLTGVGESLWAGFSTGMIYVYDTTNTPWVVKKDWRAHHEPLISMAVDRSSFWTLNRAQVISLGQDNMLRIWDGLLQDDWIETQMHSQETDFCDLKTIKTLVMTWNAGASTPYHLQHSEQDARFFRDLLQSSGSPDILVFGFQELVDLEDKKTTAKSFFKSKKKDPSEEQHMSRQYRDWRDFLTRCLDDYMPRNELYQLLHTSSLVGLFTCIFVKASLRERIRSTCGVEVKRGMGGLHGNKGALVVRFVLDNTSLCFINCHLAAGQSQTKDRNTDISAILESAILPSEPDISVRQDSFTGGGDGTMIMDHEICILNGDLNYRIDTMGRDTVVNAIKSNNLSKLLERDQLLASKRKNPWFRLRAFTELPITFAPTYKYDVGTDNYDTSEKKRAPAWCDRLLYRGPLDRVRQLDYQRHEVRVSDHRPVTGIFEMVIKTISTKKRAMKWDECQKNLLELKEKLGNQSRLDYLNFLGFDATTSKRLILQKEKGR